MLRREQEGGRQGRRAVGQSAFVPELLQLHASARRERARSRSGLRQRDDRPAARFAGRVGPGPAGMPAVPAGRCERRHGPAAAGGPAPVRAVHARARSGQFRSGPEHRQEPTSGPVREHEPGPDPQRPGLQGGGRRLRGPAAERAAVEEGQVMARLRRTVVAGSSIVAVAAVVAASVGLGGNASPSPSSVGGPSLGTAVVTRTTLRQTQQVNGTLGYGPPARVSARTNGTVTGLPALGAVINRGQQVYQVDDLPVLLLYGGRPFYRSLSSGDSGDDVQEVEQNLAALGYTGFTVDT